MSASLAFMSVAFGGCKDKEKVYAALEKYCGLDTEGMVWIVEELEGLV